MERVRRPIDRVLAAVSRSMGIDEDWLHEKTSSTISHMRHLTWWYAFHILGLTYDEIASRFHITGPTVFSGVQKIEGLRTLESGEGTLGKSVIRQEIVDLNYWYVMELLKDEGYENAGLSGSDMY